MSVWCYTCKGSGELTVQSTRGPLETDDIACGRCGGSGLDPDRLERAARAMQDVYLPSVSDVSLMFERVAAAAITAYLRGEDDE